MYVCVGGHTLDIHGQVPEVVAGGWAHSPECVQMSLDYVQDGLEWVTMVWTEVMLGVL